MIVIEPSQVFCHHFAPIERVRSTCDRDHTHVIDIMHVCGYCSRAATISFTELQVRLLFGVRFLLEQIRYIQIAV